jgi:hypothetical protein
MIEPLDHLGDVRCGIWHNLLVLVCVMHVSSEFREKARHGFLPKAKAHKPIFEYENWYRIGISIE